MSQKRTSHVWRCIPHIDIQGWLYLHIHPTCYVDRFVSFTLTFSPETQPKCVIEVYKCHFSPFSSDSTSIVGNRRRSPILLTLGDLQDLLISLSLPPPSLTGTFCYHMLFQSSSPINSKTNTGTLIIIFVTSANIIFWRYNQKVTKVYA